MKNVLRKVSALLLCLCLCLGFIPASFAAAPDEPALAAAEPLEDLGGRTVVGFEPLEDGGVLRTQSKLPLVTLRQLFPRALTVRLDDGKDGERCSVAVNWQCVEDYDGDLDAFHFIPVLPGAAPDEGPDAPTLTVVVEDDFTAPPPGYFPFEAKPAADREPDEVPMTKSVRSALPARYNSYELGMLPDVRNQGNLGFCWSFAFLGCLEADLIHDGRPVPGGRLSPLHLAYYAFHDFYDEKGCNVGDTARGENYLDGATFWLAYRTFANMVGGAAEADVPYEWGQKYQPGPYAGRAYRAPQLLGAHEIHVFYQAGRDDAKRAIMEHGAIAAVINMDQAYYSATYNSYCHDVAEPNHAIMLVGWDDDFPKENFGPVKPSTDGAWLLRNSWGGYGPLSGVEYPDYGLNGYFWISYDDACLREQVMLAFDAQDEQYDHCYGYDAINVQSAFRTGCPSPVVLSQNFRVDGGERIEAVGIETQTRGLTLALSLTNGTQTVTAKARADAVGFHLIPLQTPLSIPEDSDVTLQLTMSREDGGPIVVIWQFVAQGLNYNGSTFDQACGSGGMSLNGENVGGDGYLKLYTMDEQAQPPQAGICIDEENFPHPALRTCVSAELDLDGNGYLSETERAAATRIDLTGRQEAPDAGTDEAKAPALAAGEASRGAKGGAAAFTLKGLEHFPMLKSLLCPGCCLTGLDLSGNAALEELDCSGNGLTELDLGSVPLLEDLNCSSNKLTELDLTANVALKALDCGDNALTALTLGACSALTKLDCGGNALTELDVSKLAALTELACCSNRLTALDVTHNAALSHLDCSGNALTALTLDGCSALEELLCSKNQLTVLDVSQNGALACLDCSYDPLTALDVTHNAALTALTCSGAGLTGLDVSQNPLLERLECSGNPLTGLDVTHDPALTYLDCGTCGLAELNVRGNAELTELFCMENVLTALDVSQNPKLVMLSARSNELTALDVTGNPALKYLFLRDDHLTELDVSQNPELVVVNANGNALTALDVTGNPQLLALHCSGNALETLDVSHNAKLRLLDASHTGLTQLDLYGCADLCRFYRHGFTYVPPEGEGNVIYYYDGTMVDPNDPNLNYAAVLLLDRDLPVITDEPQILTQPEWVTALIGDAVTFSLSAEGRDLAYQWQRHPTLNDPWTAIDQEEVGPVLTLTVTEEDSGSMFRCCVWNDSATVYSDGVMLTVLRRAGDMNGDGPVNGKDATTLQRFIAGGYGVYVPFSAADLNHDGVLNAKDAILLMRYLAGGYGVTLD